MLPDLLNLWSVELYTKIIDQNKGNTYKSTNSKKVIEKFMRAGQVGCNAGWKHALKVKVEADNQKRYD